MRAPEEKEAQAEKTKREAVRFIKGIYGTSEQQAAGIFDAIAAGEVPHVRIINESGD